MSSALSHAWASWKSAPGIALLAIIAFAVGIGSTTAIFTVVNGVMLRPLPYPDGNRFVGLYGVSTNEKDRFMSLSVPDAQAFQAQTTSFDAFGWFRTGRFQMTAPGEPQSIPGAEVTADLARQLGPPQLGHWFADDQSAVISTALWRRLGQRPDIIGSAVTLEGRRYTVTGVMPPAFEMPIAATAMTSGDTQVWIPLDPSPRDPRPGSAMYFAYARRKPGVSLAQARADARRVAANIAAADPARHPFFSADVFGLREQRLTELSTTLLTLLAGAALLLLIACANVATLLLARSIVRARETAIRVALGASRRQLALAYFSEGALVSVAGAAAGVALSAVFVRQILAGASEFIPRADVIAIDWKVLGFSIALAIATGVLAGLAPLWQAMRTPPNAVLTEGVRASVAAPTRRLSQAFVIAEIALAFTLLTASAILVIHLRNLGRVSLGFDANGLLTFELPLPQTLFRSNTWRPMQARLIDSLRETPGVTDAALVNQLPTFPGCLGTSILLDDRPATAIAERVCLVTATPDLLRTMRIPLRSGRFLTTGDDSARDVLPVAINDTAARILWPDRNAVGQSGRFSGTNGDRFAVIGVVGDVRNDGLNKPTLPEIYFSASAIPWNPAVVVVRSPLPPDQLIAAVRRTIRQVDPTLAMNDVAVMNDVVHGTLQLERLSSIVMAVFGLSALLLATLGIYGVVSYYVRQRTVELGTRMAIGAVSRELVLLVLGGGVRLSLAGLAFGALALAGGVWALVHVLGITDFNWVPFVASTAVVGFVATAAAAVPAWRTTTLSPMVAMREQSPATWQQARQRLRRAAHQVRNAGRPGERPTDLSPGDVLTAFVDAAREADSYRGALAAVLTSICDELQIESAALLERRDDEAVYRPVAAVGSLELAVTAIPADGFLITRLQRYPSPLPFTPNELSTLADWATEHRQDRTAETRMLASADISLAVPLRTRDELLGVLLIGHRVHGGGFGAADKQMLRAGADQFALMIENGRLTDRVLEQETLRRDIALASDVQRHLLPDAPPRAAHAEFAAASVPARRVGGDYYDFVELSGGELGIALADVSGKGVAAALIMSVVQASLRIISSEGTLPLPQLVARMNQFVYRSTPGSKYATFFYAQLDAACRRLRYVNAGHNPPFLLRTGRVGAATAEAPLEQLTIGGTVVGMFPEMSYEEGSVDLCPGDVILIFTDGVPEAHDIANEEFGEARLEHLLRRIAHLPADQISARISDEMRAWIGDAEQYDDLTFLVIKVHQ